MLIKHLFSMNKSIIAICSMLICSCIDTKYDLGKEIEPKLGFDSEGITLPSSNTDLIELSQIVKLSENGQLTTDPDGNYLFYKSGKNMDSTIVSIGQGSICNATEDNYTYYFKQDSQLETEIKSQQYNTATMRFTTDLSPTYQPDHMSDGIRALEYVKTSLQIDIQIEFDGVSEFASNISEIRYEIPSFYVPADLNELRETQVNTRDIHRHTINTKGVDFNAITKNDEKISYDPKTGTITMIGHIKLHCTINTAHMDEYELLNPSMKIRVTAGTLGTNEVTGRFDQNEHVDVEPITFDDLPDIINNDEVVIDIDNPVVRLTVDNEVPARALINATMKAYRNEKETARLDIGEAYGTDSIKFEGSSKQTVWISRKPMEIPDTVSKNIVVDNMMDLLTKMPDKIEIDGWAHTDSSQVVVMGLNKKYVVQPTYELVAPFIIGPNMKLVYTKETGNLNSTLKRMEVSNLTMTARAINNIPLDLTATLTAKDENGREISNIVLVRNQTIKGLDESEITLTVTGEIEDFQKADKFEIKAYAESNEGLAGKTLNKNQALRLEDIKITVK